MSDPHISNGQSQAGSEAVEFKGRMLTLSVLKLNSANLEQTEKVLAAKVERAAGFFRNMPVLLDVAVPGVSLVSLVTMLKRYGLVPVAVFQPSGQVAAEAASAGLGVINDPKAARHAEAAVSEQVESSAAENVSPASGGVPATGRNATRVVSDPVRSGQQVYARGGDLIVLGAVSPGAEVLADGNIHIYGALRGRALAGVQGDTSAQIFCQQLSAELVSVAGCYKISEDIAAAVAGRAAQVYLEGERLEIAALKT